MEPGSATSASAPAEPPAASPASGEGPTPPPRPIVDLTLGAWRPREAAKQLATGLGITLEADLPSDPAASPITTGRRSIDVAAVGDPIAFLAHDDARRIASALPAACTIMVLAPRYGRGIGTLNDWLFHFLRRFALSLVIIGDEPATAMARSVFQRRHDIDPLPMGRAIADLSREQQRLLRYFPGLLPRAMAERIAIDPSAAALLAVGSSHYLIPPGYRDTDLAGAATALDAMEDVEAHDDGFKALAQTFCTAHFADSAALAGLASRAFHAGEIDLARELSTRARNVAREPAAATAADLVRQHIRLHQRRFAEILATPEPSRRAPAPLRSALSMVRLRAAVERSERDAAPAGVDTVVSRLTEGKADPDDIHLLTLHVATRIASGEGSDVAELAGQIATAAAECGDERLVFAAARDQALLARLGGDKAGEQQALARAFATSDGTRSLAEIVTMNALMARTVDDPASPAARTAWLRAAFAWLAFEPVEAFPSSSVEALLGTASVPRAQLDQRVSDAIAAALAGSTPAFAAHSGEEAPTPVIRPASGGSEATHLIGGPGAAVLFSARRTEGYAHPPSRARLASLAWAAIRELCPAAAGLPEAGTIFVDDHLGSDLPATRDAALAIALRAAAGEFCFGAEKMTIDAATRPRHITDLRVGLSPAVAAVSGPADAPGIRFRRHLDETTLSGREADVIAAVGNGGRINLGSLAVLIGTPIAETEALLRGLERRRIVAMRVEAR